MAIFAPKIVFMSLLVIGSVAFDAIETPFHSTDRVIGGAATYISLAASYYVNPVHLVAVVGEDFPASSIEMMQEHGIDTEGLQIRLGEKSFFWKGRYHTDMNSRDTLITELNVLGDFNPHIPENYQDCRYLMLGNLSPGVQQTVVERIRRRPELVAMDTMNFWMDTSRSELDDMIGKVDVMIINDEEARQLTGEYSLVRAARQIMDKGPRFVVIKKGEHGALLFHDSMVYFCPALPLEEVFDPTGAGDSFAGGFMGYLAKTRNHSFENMKRAVIYGSAMASFCVERFGPERLIELTHDQIDQRVMQFISLSQVEIELGA